MVIAAERLIVRVCVFSAILASVFFSEGAFADDWPQWRGPDRDGISDETDWFVNWPPSHVWTQQVGKGYSAVSISEGRLYTMGLSVSGGYTDTVYCLDAQSGTQIWSYSYSSSYVEYEGTRSTPTVHGSNVYTFGHEGDLFCFDKVDGTCLWSTNAGHRKPYWRLSSSPLIESNLIVLCSGGKGTAVNMNPPHNEVWASGAPGWAAYSSPTIIEKDSQRIVALTSREGLEFLDPATGTNVGSFAWVHDYPIADPLACGANRFFISTGYGKGCVMIDFEGETASEIWSATGKQMGLHINGCVVQGDYMYGFFGKVNGTAYGLKCVRINDGAITWTNLNEFGVGSLMAADGKLIALGQNGHLGLLEVSSSAYDTGGRDIVEAAPGVPNQDWWTCPVLANGKIYCRGHLGTLVCLDVGPPPADHDDDGIADSWEGQHFGGTNSCTPQADDDGDRLDNQGEYTAGTDPTNEQSFLSVTITITNGDIVVAYPTTQAGGIGYEGLSRYYDLNAASQLTGAAWEPVTDATNIPGDDTTSSYTNPSPNGVGFYRVNATLEETQ